jgi:hypothetical protein
MSHQNDNEEYIEEDYSISEQDSTLLRNSAVKRPRAPTRAKPNKRSKGRPSILPKYEFTPQDLVLVERSLATDFPNTGVDYVKIQKEIFPLREPPVTLKDVQNLVNNSPHLKNIVKEAHAKIKAEAKRKFDAAINASVDKVPASTLPPEKSNSFYQDHVTCLSSETHYGWVYRHNVAQIVEIKFNEARTELVFEVESRELLEEEQNKLILSNYLDGKAFEKVYDYCKKSKVISFNVPIPPDAVLEGYDRNDEDTSFGCLVEVYMPRKPKLNLLKLKPKRHAHISAYAITTTPLLTRTPTLGEQAMNLAESGSAEETHQN